MLDGRLRCVECLRETEFFFWMLEWTMRHTFHSNHPTLYQLRSTSGAGNDRSMPLRLREEDRAY
jgi:hypothetical protein